MTLHMWLKQKAEQIWQQKEGSIETTRADENGIHSNISFQLEEGEDLL